MTKQVEIITLIKVGLMKGHPDFSYLLSLLSIKIVKATNPWVSDSVMTQNNILKVIYQFY